MNPLPRVMGYSLRFLCTDPGPMQLTELVDSLRALNRRYQLDHESGTLSLAGKAVARIVALAPGDRRFDDALSQLEEDASEGTGHGEARVADALATVQSIVAIEVLGPGRRSEETLDSLEPVWDWLFSNYSGLLQADEEGYYDSEGLIFEVP
jgi:hypothetical protein